MAAGAFIGGTFAQQSVAVARSALDARIWGAVQLIQELLPKLAPEGSIVFTGGLSTDRPVAGAWATAVATAAAEQLARALALELAPRRVNAVAPGWTDTPMWDDIFGANKETVFKEVAAKIPLRRLVSADEVVMAIQLLFEDRSITGEIIHIDGGHRLV